MFLIPSLSSIYETRADRDVTERYERQTAHIMKTMDARLAKEQKQLKYQKAQRQK